MRKDEVGGDCTDPDTFVDAESSDGFCGGRLLVNEFFRLMLLCSESDWCGDELLEPELADTLALLGSSP